jgi:2-polyprenyl-6-methoxyphenol hydroxylase-like FAD-dependent oxidoreductase
VLALELGRRGVACVLFEEDIDPPTFPKANATTSRTMEHYRRLGFADEIRALGLPDDYPPHVTYFTRYTKYELGRLKWPSRRETLAQRNKFDPRWPTPEPLLRANQMYMEAVMRRHLAGLPSVEKRYGWQVEKVSTDESGVRVSAVEVASGKTMEFEGDYAVGCDGARSKVRTALEIRYAGMTEVEQNFMGGRMHATYFDSPAFYDIVKAAPSWQYWGINRDCMSAMAALDGRSRFVHHTQMPPGMTGTVDFGRGMVVATMGCDFPFEVIGTQEWTAGFTLIAEHYGRGRVFLAGDAAHLFTPTAGQGYNTSVDDVTNLGWKLAAVCLGWGGPNLLATYESERKPIAERNTRFARSVAKFWHTFQLPPELEDEGPAGDAVRSELGTRLRAFGWGEFDIPGIHFGVFYGGSPIVFTEPGEGPIDDPHSYTPRAWPGGRAPHLWLEEGVALFDRFGRDFTLLKLNPRAASETFEEAARVRGVPLTILDDSREETRTLYERNLILIRPDQHIAWRGDGADDAGTVIDRAVGF